MGEYNGYTFNKSGIIINVYSSSEYLICSVKLVYLQGYNDFHFCIGLSFYLCVFSD